MHKTGFPVSFVTLALFLFTFVPFRAVALTKVIKLRMSSPTETATVLRQAFGRKIRVAEAPMINAVVINGDDPTDISQAEALVAELDKPPAMLRFSLQLISEEDARGWHAEVSKTKKSTRLNAERSSRHANGKEVRTLVGLEGQPLRLTDERTRVIDLSTPWGQQTAVLKEERGLRIIGRRAGDNEAVVEVRYADGPELSSSRLLTQVKVHLGEWTYLGDVGQGTSTSGSGLDVRRPPAGIGLNRQSGDVTRNYMIKVELSSPGN